MGCLFSMNTIHMGIEMSPMGKCRPRVTKHGTYMPTKYMAWKKELARRLLPHKGNRELPLTNDLCVATEFYTKTGDCRSDMDNAHASVLDALQDAGWIKNDHQVKSGTYILRKIENKHVMKTNTIIIRISEHENK